MPSEIKLKPKVWFSLVVTLVLFVSILFTRLAIFNTRDNRTKAATCDGIITLRPNGDYYVDLWSLVPSSGYAYQKVSDSTANGDGDATYIWDDTAPYNTASFNHPATGLTNQNIVYVTVNVRARRVNGSVAYVGSGLVIGKNNVFPTGAAAATTYTLYSNTWSTNPVTNAAWTISDVDNAKIGVSSSRSVQGNAINVTQIWMDVCYQNASPPPPPPSPPPPPPPPGRTSTRLPPSPNVNTQISVNLAKNTFLQGKINVTFSIDGTSITSTIPVDANTTTLNLDGSSLKFNSNYALRVTAKNSLVKLIGFKFVSGLSLNIDQLTVGDFNSDNIIDTTDLNALINKGISGQDKNYDVNADGVVNSVDYSILLTNLGKKGN